MSRPLGHPEDTTADPSEGNRLTEAHRNHSEPAFISNADRLVVENSILNNVAGHVFNFSELTPTNFNHRPTPLHDNSAITRHPSSSFTSAMCQNDGEVYARLLLPKRLGFPLWIPQPHRNLPSEYRRIGVNIGDVGIVTSGGVFDFLFNICLPSHHRINGGRVPTDFRPLDPPEPVDIIDVAVPSTHIASRSIERSQVNPARSSTDFSFRCLAPEGAILTLPDGASREDCRGIARFREYAAQHAESWYKYVNGSRGRDAENGSIYLVTGCDKSKSWGVASFSDVSGSFNLTFVPSLDEGGNADYTFAWEHASFASTNSGPIPIEYFDGDQPRNQCTFIRGFKISLNQGLWATLFGSATRVSTIVDGKPDDMLRRTGFIPFRSRGSWLRRRLSRSGRQGLRLNKQISEKPASDEIGTVVPNGSVIITSDVPPASFPYHPSNIINTYLLEKVPDARVAITHDNDWCAIVGEDEDPTMNAQELLDRMHTMYSVGSENGVVFLVPNNTSIEENISAEGNPSLNRKSPNTNSEVISATCTERKGEKRRDLDDNSNALAAFAAPPTGETDEEKIAKKAEAEARNMINDEEKQKKAPLKKESLVKVLLPGHSECWKSMTSKSKFELLLVPVTSTKAEAEKQGDLGDSPDPLAVLLAPPPGETDEERIARVAREAEDKRVSDLIDDGLKQEKVTLKRKVLVKVLLLGQSESGKSTTLKNFQLKYATKAWKAERTAWRAVIQLNLIRSVITILEALQAEMSEMPLTNNDGEDSIDEDEVSSIAAPVKFTEKHKLLKLRLTPLRRVETDLKRRVGAESEEDAPSGPMYATPFDAPSRKRAREFAVKSWKHVLERNQERGRGENAEGSVSDEATGAIAGCREDIKAMWKDPVIRDVLAKRKIRLADSADFFLGEVDRIATRTYEPSDDDVVRARLRTIGVQEYRLKIEGTALPDWVIYDVGGSRTSRAAWHPYFDDVSAIIFLAPVSCFDEKLAEDSRFSRLEDSFILWRSICSSKLLAKATLIIFLNKRDLLEKKIRSGAVIRYHLPSYGDRPNEAAAFINYMGQKFKEATACSPMPRAIRTFATSVTDTKVTAMVIHTVRDSILAENLRRSAIL